MPKTKPDAAKQEAGDLAAEVGAEVRMPTGRSPDEERRKNFYESYLKDLEVWPLEVACLLFIKNIPNSPDFYRIPSSEYGTYRGTPLDYFVHFGTSLNMPLLVSAKHAIEIHELRASGNDERGYRVGREDFIAWALKRKDCHVPEWARVLVGEAAKPDAGDQAAELGARKKRGRRPLGEEEQRLGGLFYSARKSGMEFSGIAHEYRVSLESDMRRRWNRGPDHQFDDKELEQEVKRLYDSARKKSNK